MLDIVPLRERMMPDIKPEHEAKAREVLGPEPEWLEQLVRYVSAVGRVALALAEAEERGRPKWTPVSEPPTGEPRFLHVVIHPRNYEPCVVVSYWSPDRGFDRPNLSHWMEIPSLPEPPR